MQEPSLGGAGGELVIPRGDDARPPAGRLSSPAPRPGGASPREAKDRLPCSAGGMAESGLVSGLPTGTEAAR
jgi:hypothetical protein